MHSPDGVEIGALSWRKSSFSGPETCVEVADLPQGGRAVRDSKNPHGGMLTFNADEWSAFVAGVRAGEF
jgi:hypothetical protein